MTEHEIVGFRRNLKLAQVACNQFDVGRPTLDQGLGSEFDFVARKIDARKSNIGVERCLTADVLTRGACKVEDPEFGGSTRIGPKTEQACESKQATQVEIDE